MGGRERERKGISNFIQCEHDGVQGKTKSYYSYFILCENAIGFTVLCVNVFEVTSNSCSMDMQFVFVCTEAVRRKIVINTR